MAVHVEQVISQKRSQQHAAVHVEQMTSQRKNQQHAVVHAVQVINKNIYHHQIVYSGRMQVSARVFDWTYRL